MVSEQCTSGKEAFRHLPAATFNDPGDDCAGVVKPDFLWNAANILEDRLQSFQKAFRVFAIVQLEVAAVAVWKAENFPFS